MSYIGRPPKPEPPCVIVLEELSDIWSVLQTLSLRLAALEGACAVTEPPCRPELRKATPMLGGKGGPSITIRLPWWRRRRV